MHAPEWVCKEIERLHPYLRLAWLGEDRQSPDEDLNKGAFFLLQLYHVRDAELTMLFPWDRAGPIWGSSFDPLQRVPIIVCPLETQAVFDGSVLKLVKDMSENITTRMRRAINEEAQGFQDKIDEMADEWGDYLYYKRHRHDGNWSSDAKKFLTKEDKDMMSGDYDPHIVKQASIDSRKPAPQ